MLCKIYYNLDIYFYNSFLDYYLGNRKKIKLGGIKMKFTKEFTDQARKVIHKQSIPPVYNPAEWEHLKFNCYSYALQLKISIESRQLPIGFTTGKIARKIDYTAKFVLEQFFIDCKNLKLNCSEIQIDDRIKKNEYKVALYVWENFSYHLKRQDSNGMWSEKRGWLDPITIVKEEEILKDELYKFVGLFKISKKEE